MNRQFGKLFRYGAAYGVGYCIGYGFITFNNKERMGDYRDRDILWNDDNTEGLIQWREYMDDKWGPCNH